MVVCPSGENLDRPGISVWLEPSQWIFQMCSMTGWENAGGALLRAGLAGVGEYRGQWALSAAQWAQETVPGAREKGSGCESLF